MGVKVKMVNSPYYMGGPKKGDIGTIIQVLRPGTTNEVFKVDWGKKGIWHIRPWEVEVLP